MPQTKGVGLERGGRPGAHLNLFDEWLWLQRLGGSRKLRMRTGGRRSGRSLSSALQQPQKDPFEDERSCQPEPYARLS